ncbi:MAG: HlyC/CorC family transporter [Lachnospiraceae bacterium]|nr:HlyC/CorC family transporter [Lachnospiraceae bacterium]
MEEGSPLRRILRTLGIHTEDENVTEEDIKTVVQEGHEQGLLEKEEAVMINNIIELGETEAKDIMTHRRHIRALGTDTPLNKAVDVILSERNSRFPVYGEDIDDIRGVLYLRDAVICREGGQHNSEPIGQIPGLLRDAHFTPETRSVRLLLQEMQRDKQHLTLVVDEYGQTSGLITMEDILEEIVGDIFDEYDKAEVFITPLEGGVYLLKGMAPLEDVAETLGIGNDENFDTLNGLLISLLNRIPAEGERLTVTYERYSFHILQVKNKMIQLVRAVPIREQAAQE